LIDLVEAGPGVPEGFLQTAELATVETAEVLGGFAAQLARLDGEVRELALPDLRRRAGLAARPALADAEIETRVLDQPRASVGAGLPPGLVERLDLGAGQLLAGAGAGEPRAGVAVDAGQGHQRLERRLRRDLAHAQQLLHLLGQLLDQGQPPRGPAHAATEAARQLLETQGQALAQLGQQPALLQRRRARSAHQVALEDQRLGRRQVPLHRAHRVLAEAPQRPQTVVAVDDDVALRLAGQAHHHDRHLLAKLRHRRHQAPFPRRVADP